MSEEEEKKMHETVRNNCPRRKMGWKGKVCDRFPVTSGILNQTDSEKNKSPIVIRTMNCVPQIQSQWKKRRQKLGGKKLHTTTTTKIGVNKFSVVSIRYA